MKVPPVLVAIDELADTLTISKGAAEARAKGKVWGCVMCGWLGRVFPKDAEGRDHCAQALIDPGQGA